MRVDDATLIERAREGSADALSALYRRYWPLERGNWSATPGDNPGFGEFVFASMRTSYRAVWRGARSSAATVAVRPAVILRYRGNGLVAMVPAASSLAGRKITFQRLVAGRWRVVRQVRMKDEETAYGRTSAAQIRPWVPRSSQLRARLTLPQARPCYVGSFSNVLTID
jgi:hypothetical protein